MTLIEHLQAFIGENHVSPEEENTNSGIQFERFFPEKTLEVEELLKLYSDIPNGYNYVQKLGPRILREADPQAETYVAESLAERLIEKSGVTPDIVIVTTSHLPPYDTNDPDPQRRANHVRRHLRKVFSDSAIDPESPDNTQTVSAACSSTVVAIDWLKERALLDDSLIGQNILLIAEETGYRRTLPPPDKDAGKSGLLFSDSAIGIQFTYGKDITVISSTSPQYEADNSLLFMRVPPHHPDDPYLFVLPPPFSDTFAMNGPALRQYFAPRITHEAVINTLTPAVDPKEIDFVLSHQASARMVEYVGNLGFHSAKGYGRGIYEYGNTSSASILFDLHDGLESGAIIEGDNVLVVGYGAGLTWSAAVLRIGN